MERTIIGLGFWGVSYVLGAVSLLAGCGEVKSLGENMGGNAGTSALGSGGVAGVGADTSPVGSGGAAGAGAGGTHAGTGGSATGTPYPLAPSVPVSRNCGCDEESQVCNAASECVPRCDAEGHCAKWLLDREVSDFYVDVGTLLFLEAPTRDRLGNLLDKPQHLMYADFTLDSPIWRVELPPSSESSILGHWNHVTYVRAGGIYAVPDDVAPGSTVENMRIETPDTIYAAAFAQGTLYFAAPGGIWQMNVDTEPTPRHILDVDYGASTNYANLVIGDALWFQNGKPDQVCVFSSAGPSVECKPTQGGGFAFPQAAHGNDAFVGEYHGSVFRERFAEDSIFQLYVRDQQKAVFTNFYDLAYLNQRLYTQVDQERLLSFSTESADEPRDELSPSVLSAASGDHPALGFKSGFVRFRISDLGIFWVQQFADPEVPRYAFYRKF